MPVCAPTYSSAYSSLPFCRSLRTSQYSRDFLTSLRVPPLSASHALCLKPARNTSLFTSRFSSCSLHLSPNHFLHSLFPSAQPPLQPRRSPLLQKVRFMDPKATFATGVRYSPSVILGCSLSRRWSLRVSLPLTLSPVVSSPILRLSPTLSLLPTSPFLLTVDLANHPSHRPFVPGSHLSS
jgi:hypothetical protein